MKLLLALISLSINTSAQSSADVPAQISSPRPVDDASLLLEHLYGKVVTYEDPVLVWSGDVVPGRPYGFAMPPETGADPDLTSVLQKIIAANNAQSIGPRFRLLTSKWGYHIVPIQSHDVNGSIVEAQSLLDFPVYVPVEIRTPTQHMLKLMEAIKTASGIQLVWPRAGSPQGFDNEFRARPSSYEWGASGISGRDALIDLLDKSATTYLWSLRCQSSALSEDRFCALNMRKLAVFVTDPQGKPTLRVLRFDRCGDCSLQPPAANR